MGTDVMKMLQRAGYWKYNGAPTVEAFTFLSDAVAAAEVRNCNPKPYQS
jgi:hypothetical protein